MRRERRKRASYPTRLIHGCDEANAVPAAAAIDAFAIAAAAALSQILSGDLWLWRSIGSKRKVANPVPSFTRHTFQNRISFFN